MSAKYCNEPDACEYSDCPTAFCDRENKSELAAMPCSPSDLLPWVIAELRAKHAEAEALMIDRDPQQKHALNEFNIFAFNNVPFLADQCEALMKANDKTLPTEGAAQDS